MGSDGYLSLPGSEAYFWYFYNVNLKKFEFCMRCPPPSPDSSRSAHERDIFLIKYIDNNIETKI